MPLSERLARRLVVWAMLTASPAIGVAQEAAKEPDACSPPPTTAPTPQQEARAKAYRDTQERLIHVDWPNFERYRDSNVVLGPPKAGEQRVVFLGNSITEGWAPRFASMFPGKPYIGRGIGGQTTPQMLVRFRADVVALKPAAVVILGGTNDIAGNTGPATIEMIEDNLAAMTEIAKANGIRVVLSSVLPVYKYRWAPSLEPALLIVKLNAWMKDYAAGNGAVYLDYETTMSDEKHGLKCELTYDGVHPNTKGYRVMSLLAEKAITDALRGAH
ncbi:MAG: SGNH/GDSL hydrolase family protein [Gemmatimonadaceae bacterium]